MTFHIKNSGSWYEITQPSVKVSGTWHDVSEGWVKVAGVWRQFYSAGIVLTNSGTVANYNLYNQVVAALGSAPPSGYNITFINTGIIYATTTSTAALTINGFTDQVITIVNSGAIYGKGGAGGNGTSTNGTNGGAGGDAVSTTINITFDNTGGELRGGGGGGGGGATSRARSRKLLAPSTTNCSDFTSYVYGYGGGGGGGRSYSNASGGTALGTAANGGTGTSAGGGSGGADDANVLSCYQQSYDVKSGLPDGCMSGGSRTLIGGNGGAGGNWGSSGSNGGTASNSGSGTDFLNYTAYTRGTGGAGGKAMEDNGRTVTWLGTGTRSGAIT